MAHNFYLRFIINVKPPSKTVVMIEVKVVKG